jgi:hypothetical protein
MVIDSTVAVEVNSSTAMIYDVLPTSIHFVQGSYSPTVNNTVNITNFQTRQIGSVMELQWFINEINLNNVFEVEYKITCDRTGKQNVNLTKQTDPDNYSRFFYRNYRDMIIEEAFNDTSLFVAGIRMVSIDTVYGSPAQAAQRLTTIENVTVKSGDTIPLYAKRFEKDEINNISGFLGLAQAEWIILQWPDNDAMQDFNTQYGSGNTAEIVQITSSNPGNGNIRIKHYDPDMQIDVYDTLNISFSVSMASLFNIELTAPSRQIPMISFTDTIMLDQNFKVNLDTLKLYFTARDASGNFAWMLPVFQWTSSDSSLLGVSVSGETGIAGVYKIAEPSNTTVVKITAHGETGEMDDIYFKLVVYGSDIDQNFSGRIPETFSLNLQPNPFNSNIILQFSIPFQEKGTSLKIYSSDGTLVNSMNLEGLVPGYHQLTWNGVNKNGFQMPSGWYLARFNAHNKIINKKLILLR